MTYYQKTNILISLQTTLAITNLCSLLICTLVILWVAEKWFSKLGFFSWLETQKNSWGLYYKTTFFQVAEPLFCHPQNHF